MVVIRAATSGTAAATALTTQTKAPLVPPSPIPFMPPGVNGEQLAQQALKQSMVLAPGALFGYDPALRDSMRFNVAHSDGPGVQQAFETLLLKAVRDR